MPTLYLTIFLLSVAFLFLFKRYVRNAAIRRGWVVAPSPHHIHGTPIPRLGGVAIYTSFITAAAALLVAPSLLRSSLYVDVGPSPKTVLYILAAGTVVFALGLYDDFRPLSPYVKFSVQGIAAVLLYLGGLKVIGVPILFGARDFGWVALPLTVLWVLWITNAFNLIDGLDGLAAGSALFSTLVTCVVAMLVHNGGVLFLTLVLAGAIAGFLRYNFNPASIFLGDSGSLLI